MFGRIYYNQIRSNNKNSFYQNYKIDLIFEKKKKKISSKIWLTFSFFFTRFFSMNFLSFLFKSFGNLDRE